MTGILVNGLWQGAIIVALATLVTRYLVRESAATRYAVWVLSLLALVVVPAITLLAPLHVPALDRSAAAGAAGQIRITLVEAARVADRAWASRLLAELWAIGAIVMLVRLGLSALRIERIRTLATPVIAGSEAVLASDDIAIPIATGVLAPAVIVPSALLERLSAADLRRVIAHERAHISRKDVAANYAQRIFEALLWFNPWVYAISNRLIHEREAACDDLAIAATGESHEYAACLASLAQTIARRSSPLLSPSVFGSRRALIERIERLVSGAAHRTVEMNYGALAITAALFAGATLLLQLFSPAIASPVGSASGSPAVFAAASCANPQTPAIVTNPAVPDFPKNAHPKKPALVRVGIAADGSVTSVTLVQSSGDALANQSAVDAAMHSTYHPATRDCTRVAGSYLFRVEFAPNP